MINNIIYVVRKILSVSGSIERLKMQSGDENSSGRFNPMGHLQQSTVGNFAVQNPYSNIIYTYIYISYS